MNDELQKTLAQLAQKLGTSVDHLWSVLIRQAPIDSTVWTLVMMTMLAVIYAAWRMFHSSKEDSDLKVISAICLGAMIIATFIVFSTGLANVIAGFFNPEYWALQDLLSKIHGD